MLRNAVICFMALLFILQLPACSLAHSQSIPSVTEALIPSSEATPPQEAAGLSDETVNALDEAVEIVDRCVWETAVSPSGVHRISTIATRNGIYVEIDGTEYPFDDIAVRYSPCVNDSGTNLYAQQTPGSGYDAILNGNSVLHSGACIDFCRIGDTTGVFVESDTGKECTRVYTVDLASDACECAASLKGEYMEESRTLNGDRFGFITSSYTASGDKLYHLYCLDAKETHIMKLVGDFTDLITFPDRKSEEQDDRICIERLSMSENDRFFYNAVQIWKQQYGEPFSSGNDFRGRLSWNESERLRGLCELFLKTGYSELNSQIRNAVSNILAAQNDRIGIPENEWNPGFLWTSKAYSDDNEPVSILIENAEILSALLYACNEGIVSKRSEEYAQILQTAEAAFDYYDQWYENGHYYLPYGYPTSTDGLVVLWNYQNSMAETALGLFIETGDKLYLKRCEELIREFQR